MKLTTFTTSLVLLALHALLATATPVPDIAPFPYDPDFDYSFLPDPNEGNNIRSCTCGCRGILGMIQKSCDGVTWRIQNPNDTTYSKYCGRSVLDNVRGRCGWVKDWTCDLEYDNTTDKYTSALMTFSTDLPCTRWMVTQAFKASTLGEIDLPCTGDCN